uniref:Uncharacterized protein n=1 Tax=Oryza glumipatula TaxID=40148 RepID=A0A0E0BR26_9ORYZ
MARAALAPLRHAAGEARPMQRRVSRRAVQQICSQYEQRGRGCGFVAQYGKGCIGAINNHAGDFLSARKKSHPISKAEAISRFGYYCTTGVSTKLPSRRDAEGPDAKCYIRGAVNSGQIVFMDRSDTFAQVEGPTMNFTLDRELNDLPQTLYGIRKLKKV